MTRGGSGRGSEESTLDTFSHEEVLPTASAHQEPIRTQVVIGTHKCHENSNIDFAQPSRVLQHDHNVYHVAYLQYHHSRA
jgi:hypothetical protein